MRQGVGHQGEAPEDDVRAQEAVGESDQHASEQCPSHELVMEWLGDPVHSVCPLKIFVV